MPAFTVVVKFSEEHFLLCQINRPSKFEAAVSCIDHLNGPNNLDDQLRLTGTESLIVVAGAVYPNQLAMSSVDEILEMRRAKTNDSTSVYPPNPADIKLEKSSQDNVVRPIESVEPDRQDKREWPEDEKAFSPPFKWGE